MELLFIWWISSKVPELPPPREPFALVLQIKANKKKIKFKGGK